MLVSGASGRQKPAFERLKAPLGPKKTIFRVFFNDLLVIFGNYWGWGAVDKSAASAASPDSVKFQAVIKSAASAASQIQGTQVQGSARSVARAPVPSPEPRSVVRPPTSSHRPPSSGAPLDLGSLDLGGCARSRLDHGLKFYGIRGGCASSQLIHLSLIHI